MSKEITCKNCGAKLGSDSQKLKDAKTCPFCFQQYDGSKSTCCSDSKKVKRWWQFWKGE